MRYMDAAYRFALESDAPNRHGCTIARKNTLMGFGVNKQKTHPAAAHTISGHIHAEMAAIIMCKNTDLHGADLYTCRVMRKVGEARGMGKPCKDCMVLIRDAGIKRVYYTNINGEMEMIRL
jgi:deoxycytidylate deaminase